jgi:hypothetical protein
MSQELFEASRELRRGGLELFGASRGLRRVGASKGFRSPLPFAPLRASGISNALVDRSPMQ